MSAVARMLPLSAVPWWGKIAAKIVLSRIPVAYEFWRARRLFQHGAMDEPLYALEGFRELFEMADRPGGAAFTVLELGPGDSLFSALVVHALGGARCWLVDAGPFATSELGLYGRMVDELDSRGLRVPPPDALTSLTNLLEACNTQYLTAGLDSLRTIPDESVDFIWSRAVLEHVRRHEFPDTLGEFRRILKPGGASVHRVDLRDHLGGRLDNLRFSDRHWESDLMARSGFYTNRIRHAEMLRLFETAGFEAEVTKTSQWDTLPTPRARLAPRFRGLDDADLMISGFDVVLRLAAHRPG